MRIKNLLLILTILNIAPIHAGLMPASTRVIYQADKQEVSLMLANTNDYPVLVQNWVDEGNSTPEKNNAPFIILPPLFHMAAQEVRGIRIIYNHNEVPGDRESVFWLNLYEIPPKSNNDSDARQLTLAMNTQMKIFFRPAGLSTKSEEAAEKLLFHLRTSNNVQYIECKNPTAYHISFTSIVLHSPSGRHETVMQPDMMVSPFSTKKYQLKDNRRPLPSTAVVDFRHLNDAGEQLSLSLPLVVENG